MIAVSNLSMHYGQKVLFEDVSLQFNPGKRYGLVGANGSGKTTFLRILSGEEIPSSGEVTRPQGIRLGLLKQDHFQYETSRVLDVVLQGKPRLWNALREKEQLLEHPETDHDTGHRLGQLEEIIASENGYVAESFAGELLSGLGIGTEFHAGPMKALSGGFKLRVLLAQTLFQEPDVLLLDEPTNHLDIFSIRWLEMFLKNEFQGTLIFISHDRDFLNAASTHVVDVDYETLRLYHSNYDGFLKSKQEAVEQTLREIASQEKKVAEMQAFVDRFKAKATKARQAQSRVKQIEKIQIDEVKRSSRVSPKLQFEQKRPSGKSVLNVKNLCKSFGKVSVLQGISLDIHRGEKVAVIGPNGIGKSTLLKVVLKQLPADEGTFEWGYETHVSYFAQDYHESLKDKCSVYEWLYQFAPHESIGLIRGLLARALFSGDDVEKPIQSLSGGESARLLFAKMMLDKGNVLVLDEPTNHLDLEGVDALMQGLMKYEGSVIVVSHDRYFVSKVATHILELTEHGAKDYPGTYAEYLGYVGADYLDRNQTLSRTRTEGSVAKPSVAAPLSYEERKNLKREIARLTKLADQLEKKIAEMEGEVASIETTFGDPEFFQTAAPAAVEKLTRTKQQLGDQITETMRQWERALEQLEKVQASNG